MSDSIQTLIEQLPLCDGVGVIEQNEDGLLALYKPSGVLSHPNEESADRDIPRSLIRASYDHKEEVYEWENSAGLERKAWLINRLDSATSGVILIALEAKLAEMVQTQFASHHVDKVYYALVRDKPRPAVGEWKDNLKKNVFVRKHVTKNALNVSAKTRYHLSESASGSLNISLIKLMPLTGRTHQLRVQCAKHGHPIVGDRTYGSFSFNREVKKATEARRMMLHSAETTVRYAYKGVNREFSASSPIPAEFYELLRYRITPAQKMEQSRQKLKDQAAKKRAAHRVSPVKKRVARHLNGRRFRA